MTRDAARIIVFARAPVPGRCKTRLIPRLGATGAAALQRRLTRRTVRVALACGAQVELWGAPDASHGFFLGLRRSFGVRLRRQPAGDLGRRMAMALRGRHPSIVVGTDCPTLDAADLRAACRLLDRRDCVLQPSHDGGYVLIGTRFLPRRALAGIAWSSGRELGQTRRRLLRLGLTREELVPREDLDTPSDYRRARRAGRL